MSDTHTISITELLGTAYELKAMSKVLTDWLCNHAPYNERGTHEPDAGDMVALSGLLAGKCIALVATLDNPNLEVTK